MCDLIDGVTIMFDENVKERIFKTLINCEIATYTSYYAPDRAVVSISNIIELLGDVTKYAARQALKRLRKDGLVEYTSQGCPAAPPINGYCITKKGFETPEWKQAYKEWCKSMEDWTDNGDFCVKWTDREN